MSRFSTSQQDRLVVLLESCRALSDARSRAQLVARLPAHIRPHVRDDAPSLRAFLIDLVDGCAGFEGGVAHLRDALQFLEGETYAMQAVADLVSQLGDEITDASRERWDARLSEAIERKHGLIKAGAPTDDIEREIATLERRVRPSAVLQAGDQLGDRYLLRERLGEGGLGCVWRADDVAQGEPVAIKVLRSHLASDPRQRARFFGGARVMSELAHPAVVGIREPEAEADGVCYFVMDFIGGGDLRRAVLDGRATSAEQVPVLLAVTEVIAHAHARGHVHGDIKPANILLNPAGEPRLTDFDPVSGSGAVVGSRADLGVGTLYFAPPELIQGGAVDTRADVFSLGMTAVFMIYGDDLPLEVWTERDAFLAKLECPPALRAVIERAVALDPAVRYVDAAAFGEALRAAARELSVASDTPSSRSTAPLPVQPYAPPPSVSAPAPSLAAAALRARAGSSPQSALAAAPALEPGRVRTSSAIIVVAGFVAIVVILALMIYVLMGVDAVKALIPSIGGGVLL